MNLERFLKGATKNLERMIDAGLLDASLREEFITDYRERFAYLEDEPVEDGDTLIHLVRGDSVYTRHHGTDGSLRFEGASAGAERRLAVLCSMFLKGSDFRKGLLKSLCD